MIAQQHSSVTGFAMSQQNGVDKVELTILVSDTKHLQKIINAIRTIDTVRLVSRHLESTPAMKPVDARMLLSNHAGQSFKRGMGIGQFNV